MDKKIHRTYNYLNHLIKSKHRKSHGIHSPFIYEFVSQVVYDRKLYPEYTDIRNIRNELKNSGEVLPVKNMGARSNRFTGDSRSVKDLVSLSSVQPRIGELLFRMTRHYKPSTIIELGTSIGLSTLYLAKGAPDAQVVTVEGNKESCEFVRSLFKKYKAVNIKAINGMFDDYLSYFKDNYPSPGLVFIDGNHTHEATLRYFRHFASLMEEGFIIIDDINWSDEMRKAWKEITLTTSNRVTLDLFFMGIVIFRKSITPGHFLIRL